MNGWQRIGVVVSALWCFAVIGYAGYEAHQLKMSLLKRYDTVPAGSWNRSMDMYIIEIEKTAIDTASLYDLLQKHQSSTSEQDRALLQQQMATISRDEYYISLTSLFIYIFLGPIAALWLLAYASLTLWKWIAAGFSARK